MGGSWETGRRGVGAPAGQAQTSRRKAGRLQAGNRLLELTVAAQRGAQHPSWDTPAMAAAATTSHSQPALS